MTSKHIPKHCGSLLEVRTIVVDGIRLFLPFGISMIRQHLDDFPESCGPGQGIAELAVPEHFFGLRMSPACHIHDLSWSAANASWGDFHVSNLIFLANMMSIIMSRSSMWPFVDSLRMHVALRYFQAVSSREGAKIFWRLHDSS